MKLKNKGITLIALVITIIILLILAGVTIGQLTKNELFEKVQLAKEKSEKAQEKENVILDNYENTINNYIDSTRDSKSYNYQDDGEVIITNDTYNGKIIKKVCLTGTIHSGLNKFLDLSSYNIDKILDISGYSIVNNGKNIAMIRCNYSSVAYIDFWYNISDKYLHSSVGTEYDDSVAHIIITYTDN